MEGCSIPRKNLVKLFKKFLPKTFLVKSTKVTAESRAYALLLHLTLFRIEGERR